MDKNFADQVIEAVEAKGNPICVGLDPRLDQMPKHLVEKHLKESKGSPTKVVAEIFLEFNQEVIDAVADLVPVVKPQVAFYEMYGADGVWAYEETLKYAREKGVLTIADVKRNDIGSTAQAYARAFLGQMSMFSGEQEVITPVYDADSLTINAYLGWDGVKPFVEEASRYGKGVFVLVKTSNPSSGDIQDVHLDSGESIFELMGHYVDSWGQDLVGKRGYSSLGAVVGATYPDQAAKLRKIMPKSLFLVPGYGAQGGGAEDVLPCFNDDGLGALVNSSRGIIFAYERMDDLGAVGFAEAARRAVLEMEEDLKRVLG